MKHWKLAWIAAVCGLMLLAGCKKETETPSQTEAEQPEETESREEETRQQTEAPETAGEFEERDLTNEELREFTRWINQGSNYGNYGFLLSEYVRPEDADLEQIFYSGAGLETEQMTPKETEAYLTAVGADEIYTDCTRLTTSQINEVLEQKLGCHLEDMTKEFMWVYLPDSDAYVWEHGDTNYMNFTCVSGRQTGADTYELECVPGDENYTPYVPSCRVTLQKNGDDYRFLSNVYTAGVEYSKDIWKIEDQSFRVDLGAPWGDVFFVSYAPDQSAYGTLDVTFSIVKPSDGVELFELPGVMEDNYRTNERFSQVQAVTFKDYDGDGDLDIIILVEYQMNIHTEETDKRQEVRIYRNRSEEGDFVLDVDRMDYLQMSGLYHSIDEIMQHINEYEME